MVLNALRTPSWNFEVPNIQNALAPIQQGMRDYRQIQQQGVENDRADRGMAIQEGQFGLQKQKFASEQEAQEAQRIGRLAQVVDEQQDPGQRAQMLQRLYSASPAMRDALTKYGIDPNDHARVPKFIMAQAGIDPLDRAKTQAQINASNASAAASMATAKNTGLTDPIREFNFAKSQGFAGSFEDFKKQNANTNASQNITWGRDDAGNWVPMQATRDGRLVASALPPNVAAIPSPEQAYAKALATEQGQAAGKAVVDLPAVETNANLMRDAITAVERDPNLGRMTGWSGNLPNVTPAARDTQAKIDQVQGKAFLQAFAGLRGGGAITEAEGAKATASLSRLQETRVGTPEYRKALSDVRREIDSLVELARRKAQLPGGMGRPLSGSSQEVAPAPQATAPQVTGEPRTVRTVEEAMALPPGTTFRTPDGKLKVRP